VWRDLISGRLSSDLCHRFVFCHCGSGYFLSFLAGSGALAPGRDRGSSGLDTSLTRVPALDFGLGVGSFGIGWFSDP
jgi:hypothetical protein